MDQRDCEFCGRLADPDSSRPWYDFGILEQNDNFVVVAALGALVPGHIMIVTRQHELSSALLDPAVLVELDELVARWTKLLRDYWGSCFLFEHGGSSGSGSCIVHAHLQMLPLAEMPDVDDLEFRPLGSIGELSLLSATSYLLISVGDGFAVTSGSALPGQFLRRRIAAILGSPEEWDYLLYPNLANVQATIDALRHDPRSVGGP